MLDENLPLFIIKSSSESPYQSTIFLGQGGNDLKPEYTLRKPDPKVPAAKNCYAVGISDSYNPDAVFGEVMVQPEWTTPTLSAAELRAQNGTPPPPVPIVPSSFTIQLYNPDQQIVIRQSETKWTSSNYWEFEMPQQTFRMPSASSLDRSQDDPTALDITPKVQFKWKRDSKFARNIACYMGGKSTNGKKSKEPDITLAMFKHGKELTVYEPNMHRVDVEDRKGLEVVMLLSAIVIRDIFFDANREMFNISGPPPNSSRRKNSNPVIGGKSTTNFGMSGANAAPNPPGCVTRVPTSQIPTRPPNSHKSSSSSSASRPPPADARTQWEIDTETARLQKLVEAEEKERAAQEAAEERRLRRMLEEEEAAAQRQQREIDAETERLRQQYGVSPTRDEPAVHFASDASRPGHRPQQSLNASQTAPHTQPVPMTRPLSTGSHTNPERPVPNGSVFYPATNSWGSSSRPVLAAQQQQQQQPMPQNSNNPYLQPSGTGNASSSGFFGRNKVPKKRSVFF